MGFGAKLGNFGLERGLKKQSSEGESNIADMTVELHSTIVSTQILMLSERVQPSHFTLFFSSIYNKLGLGWGQP